MHCVLLLTIAIVMTFQSVRAFHVASRSAGMKSLSRLAMSAKDVSYKYSFLFPGQGAQSVGMAGALCNEVPAAKALFDEASSILGYDLLAKVSKC